MNLKDAIIANAKIIADILNSTLGKQPIEHKKVFTKNDIRWIYYNYQEVKKNEKLLNGTYISSLQSFTEYCNVKFEVKRDPSNYCKYGNHGLKIIENNPNLEEGVEHVYTYPN